MHVENIMNLGFNLMYFGSDKLNLNESKKKNA